MTYCCAYSYVMMYATTNNLKHVSINPDQQLDTHYRYKMPQLHIEYMKKFTILKNIGDVAKALHVEVNMITKYLTSKLKTRYIDKKSGYSGIHSIVKISNIIQEFIEKYVICDECSLPELDKLNTCHACGACKVIK